MARRLYLGKLPPDTRSEDINKFFDGAGRIVDCRVMTGFGFVEFESSRDAEDALNQFNGKPFQGESIVIEFAKESRPRREPFEFDNTKSRRRPGHRIVVTGLSRDTSWQDLKDFGREAGNVSFSDIDRDSPGTGYLEYQSREDADQAVKELDGRDLRGRPVRVALDEQRGGADNYRRDDRRDDRGYRDDRSYSRRDRSRSPHRYEDRDRRPRSPPARRDYDDRRPSGYEDRRGGYEDRRGGHDDRRSGGYDDRRSERYRAPPSERPPREDFDSRRSTRDEGRKDERTEDRPARSANGEAGWAR